MGCLLIPVRYATFISDFDREVGCDFSGLFSSGSLNPLVFILIRYGCSRRINFE